MWTKIKQYLERIFDGIIGGLAYRIRGGLWAGSWIDLPRPWPQAFMALPYGFVCRWAGANWSTAIVTFLLVAVAFSSGHGQWQDLGHYTLPVSPEKLDFIVAWFWGPDTFHSYWRDATGLLVSGLSVTLGPAIIILEHHHWKTGAAMLVSGISKPLAYMIGWGMFDHGWLAHFPTGFSQGTEIGEFLTGFFLWASLGIIALHIKATPKPAAVPISPSQAIAVAAVMASSPPAPTAAPTPQAAPPAPPPKV